MADVRRESIKALPLFHGVSDSSLTLITDAMVQEFESGSLLVSQGDAPRFLYVLMTGSVDISAKNSRDVSIYIASREQGSVIGEQAFIETSLHSADVTARGRITVLRIPRREVNVLLADPAFCRNLLRSVSSKLREATKHRADERFERRLLFANFASHVNPEVVSDLLQRGDDSGEPQRTFGFVLFSDLRSFTRLARSMTPKAVADELAPYFERIVDTVHQAYGIVDKYIGDAVMAVWGHPALGTPDANDVMDAALAMVSATQLLTFGGEPMKIGIGINAGELFLGNIGTDKKRSFTVLGDAVNMAARYETANKDGDHTWTITLGPEMYTRLDENHRRLLTTREHTTIPGAVGNKQTVFSL